MTIYYKYNVFVSYSRSDREAAESVARLLRDAGLRVWLDAWYLVPGERFRDSLERALAESSSVAFLVGPSGLSKWQEEELVEVLSKQGRQQAPRVIPVLLPGADPENMPSSLLSLARIDLSDASKCEKNLIIFISEIESSEAEDGVAQEQRIGDSLRAAGDLAEAASYYERALGIARTAYGESHPVVANLLVRLANAKQDQGDYSAALGILKKALEIGIQLHGSDSEALASTFNNLGSVLLDLGRLEEARECFTRALDIDERALGPDHPNIAVRLNNLATLFEAQGRLAEAEPLLRRALAAREAALGPGHPDTATSVNNLAYLLYRQGKLAEAEPLLRRALAAAETALGPDHPDVAVVRGNLAGLLDEMNRRGEPGDSSAQARGLD